MVHLPQHRKQWTQEKNNFQGQLTDETYHGILGYHNPIWRHLINKHDGKVLHPINVLGYTAIPLAVEFAQWGFPVTYITDSYQGVKKAKTDCEIHSGVFKELLHFDFYKNCPQAKLTIFINIIDDLQEDEIFTYLDVLLRRTREIVCAVRNDRSWKDLLDSKYDVDMSEYKDKQFCLLIIKEHE